MLSEVSMAVATEARWEGGPVAHWIGAGSPALLLAAAPVLLQASGAFGCLLLLPL